MAAALTKESVLAQLKQVEDPEIRYNIVDLGLIYDVKLDGGMVVVDMTLTSPTCPVGPYIISEAENAVKKLSFGKQQHKYQQHHHKCSDPNGEPPMLLK